MTQSSTEFAQQSFKAPSSNASTATAAPTATVTARRNCDILLNNFQIKKKRYRVLLNHDHIVWERLDAAKHQNHDAAEKITQKEAEFESEQLSNRAAYGSTSNVVHLNEIIRVAKGATKSSTLRITTQPSVFNGTVTGTSGEQPNSTTKPPTEQYLTVHYAERIVKSETDCNRWHVRHLTLFNADPYIVKQWHALLLSKMLKKFTTQRLLVFINPFGGRKQGLQAYERHCKPLFQLAGIDASCIISQRANQIRDILMTHDLSPFDAVCCVGGDGTVAEVINGLLFRTMRDLGIDALRPEYIPKPTLPVGIIPAGSTDTVAYSLHGTSDVRTAAIHMILGQRRGLDICSVRNRQGLVRFCASVLSYGYLGDVAAKSEKYRWMGTKRYEYTGVKAFLTNRGYDAEVRMLLPEQKSDSSDMEKVTLRDVGSSILNATDRTTAAESICYANCQRCSIATVSTQISQSLMEQSVNSTCGTISDEIPTSSNMSLYAQKSIEDNTRPTDVVSIDNERNDDNFDHSKNINLEDCDSNVKAVVLEDQLAKDNQIKELLSRSGASSDASKPQAAQVAHNATRETSYSCYDSQSSINNSTVDKLSNNESHTKWKVIKGKFFMICGANITCACTRSPNGISRYSHLGDGNLDLIFVRKTSIFNNLRFALNTMGRNGDIRNLPFVEVYRTRRFHFRTLNCDEDNYSISGSCQPITEPSADAESAETSSSWNCDGEVVTDLDIVMSSHCQLIDVFMRGPFSYNKPTTSEKKCCC